MAKLFSGPGWLSGQWSLLAAALFVPSVSACTGIISGSTGDGPDAIADAPGSGAAQAPDVNPVGGAASPAAGKPSSFQVPTEQPVLLPFETRLNKLAAVVGVPTSDPMFDLARQNAARLGDYDFANGVVPDSTWTALRISLWVKSLKPVCASAAMAARFPSLPESLSPFIEAAYGRAATDEDLADVQAAQQGLTLSAEQRTRTLCLTLLSSTELVIQ